jgi:hypothetical protein
LTYFDGKSNMDKIVLGPVILEVNDEFSEENDQDSENE